LLVHWLHRRKNLQLPAKPAPAAPAVALSTSSTSSSSTSYASIRNAQAKAWACLLKARGGFTLGNGTSSSYLNGDASTATAHDLQLANQVALAVAVQASVTNLQTGLGLVASFDYRSFQPQMGVTNKG
jgi:hypothetical protein